MKASILFLSCCISILFIGCKKDDQKPSTVPVLSTSAATSITRFTATTGGNISDDGNLNIQERGVCYSDTTATPTIYNWKTSEAAGTGAFTSGLKDLLPNTTYYVRAYAKNLKGVGYGSVITFATEPMGPIPVLGASAMVENNSTFAVLSSSISSDAGSPIIDRGFCWAINKIPTIKDKNTQKGGSVGNFSDTLKGLTYATSYWVRSYATNSNGVGYGEPFPFKTNAGVPVLTTQAPTDIYQGTVTLNGTLTYNAGAEITERGFVVDTAKIPTINTPYGPMIVPGSDYNPYKKVLSNWPSHQTYYVRAYAVTSGGVGYGNVMSFTIRIPEVFTSPDLIKKRPGYLIVSGTALNGYSRKITERGFVYGINPNPSFQDVAANLAKYVIADQDTGLGEFTDTIKNLVPNKNYYVRAYAKTLDGVGYGLNQTFTTDAAYLPGTLLEGGLVFFVNPDKSSGLIVATDDLPLPGIDICPWGCEGINVSTTDTFGLTNSYHIVENCATPGTAARICFDYEYNGYSDWYLPSQKELAKLHKHRIACQVDFPYYWSSTQINAQEAAVLKFDGTFINEPKSTGNHTVKVRPIRVFE